MTDGPHKTQESYDQVAADYTRQFQHELAHKPFDRQMLTWLSERVATVSDAGLICDLGCGPGHIAQYLAEQGAQVCGIDLSPQMVVHAAQNYPHIAFQQGNMLALTAVADRAFAGIAAFYSIIHVPSAQIPQALREMWRVLCPNGVLLFTFHIGDEVRHLDTWLEKQVDLDFYFFKTPYMRQQVEAAGFVITEALERDPYPEIEVQTRRAYIFAVKSER